MCGYTWNFLPCRLEEWRPADEILLCAREITTPAARKHLCDVGQSQIWRITLSLSQSEQLVGERDCEGQIASGYYGAPHSKHLKSELRQVV